ncbi:MAG: O-antigen ligase family protein [Bacteroidaceae bacterium]|nr:O-antigen ligase family protein [Bacteroidaceae bacterium]
MTAVILALGILVLFYGLYLFCTKPWAGFIMTIVLNYFIMGLGRYTTIPLPISVIIEAVFILYIIILFSKKDQFTEDGKIPASLFAIYGIWTLYCTLEIINDTCNLGIDVIAWFKDVRYYGYDPLLCMTIFAMIICSKKDVKKFLQIIGVILIIAGIKCFWQKTFGFDYAESAWLEGYGARTHIINGGTLTRYFSFFSDAANYGSHCAIFGCVYGFLALFHNKKEWKTKLFYGVVAVCCIYGMFMSGTRTAIFVFLGSIFAYVILSRNAKMFGYAALGLLVLVGVLIFTNRGNSIQAVRRMRSAFNLEQEASVEVRDLNKEALSKYLAEAPLGIGLGKDRSNVPQYNRYYLVVDTPPDSSLVYFWMQTGIVGVSLFTLVCFIILACCTYKVWFKIKDPELQTICALFTAAAAGWFAAGYANQVYFQYPNSLIVFGMQTIVFLGPYLDKKLQEEKEQKELENLEVQDVELIDD